LPVSPPSQPPRKRHKSIAIAIAIICLLVGSSAFAYGIYLSNVLMLGPYATSTQKPIVIAQVDPPTSCTITNGDPTSNATMNTLYDSAVKLPSGSGWIIQSVWYKTGISLAAPQGSSFSVIEHYNLTYTGTSVPSAGDLMLLYCGQTPGSQMWITLHPTYSSTTKSWSGTITPTGFALPTGYTSTTPVMLSVLQPGNYTCLLWFTEYP